MSDDWLALADDKPVGVPAPASGAGALRRGQIAQVKRQLTLAQRKYAACLAESRGNTREADRRFARLGFPHKAGTLGQWRGKPYFRRLVELLTEEALDSAGVTPAKTLLTMDGLAEYGAETVIRRNKYGQAVTDEDGVPVTEMRDPHLALKATEFMGRHFKLWGDGDDKRVVVNIVDLTGASRVREDPLEGEAEDVTPR